MVLFYYYYYLFFIYLSCTLTIGKRQNHDGWMDGRLTLAPCSDTPSCFLMVLLQPGCIFLHITYSFSLFWKNYKVETMVTANLSFIKDWTQHMKAEVGRGLGFPQAGPSTHFQSHPPFWRTELNCFKIILR